MDTLIDPEGLPFTSEEICHAARQFMPESEAQLVAEHLARCGPSAIADRATQREEWRAEGRVGGDTHPVWYWVYPEQLLPALAALGGDTEVRARRLFEADLNSRMGSTDRPEGNEQLAQRRARWEAMVARFRGANA